ncbi:MAG: SpoIID/LytB domain-containing protein [Bacillota bacterium]|nr:SpoIID/LytB domain-containing protein [Bacillota bacterium]
MRKFKKKLITLCLVFALFVPTFSFASLADDDIPDLPVFDLPCSLDTVKVGLCHGSSAVSAATFQCKTGNDFQIGYFDYSRNFHTLGRISNDTVTLHGDIEFTVGEDDDAETVGSWHILLGNSYGSFDEAASAASKVNGFPGYVDYKYVVLVGAYESSAEATTAMSDRGLKGSAYSGSSNSVIISKADSAQLLFMYDSAGRKLAIRPGSDNSGETRFNGNTYKGAFSFSRKGSSLCVTNFVGLEDYVKGVLPYEVSADWPAEALKAQAVCARTYAINCINSYADRDFDVRDDTYSQVYKGSTYSDSVINAAADDTAGMYVRYEGAVCKVYYMSSDGGGTEDGINVFGERRAYLAAVADSFEVASDFYGKTWREEYTASQLSYKLCDHGFDIGDITEIETTYSDIGNVIRLDFKDTDGNTAFIERLECYSVLGLNSIRYDVSVEETDDGEKLFVFEGCGWGHNCGMSQWGACTMAKNSNVDCNDIIRYYFSGAYIA